MGYNDEETGLHEERFGGIKAGLVNDSNIWGSGDGCGRRQFPEDHGKEEGNIKYVYLGEDN